MAYILVLIVCYMPIVFVYKSTALGLEEGDSCKLRSDQTGYCTNVFRCEYAYILRIFGYNPEICGFEGRTPIVCCTNITYESQLESKSPTILSQDSSTLKPPTLTTSKLIINPQNETRTLVATPIPFNQSKISISAKKCSQYYPIVKAILIPTKGEGGVKAEKDLFRHMAAIGYGETTQWLCGGSLISLNFVLTAAHCTYTLELGKPNIVRLGDIKLLADNQSLIQDIAIKRIFVHPNYTLPKRHHDIGLLELARNAIWSISVAPACLDTSAIRWEHWNHPLIATGWGQTSFASEMSNDLLRVDLDVVPFEQCHKYFVYLNDSVQMCAGDGNQKDTCEGDSGGPLQILHPDFPTWRKVFQIIGITSYGAICGITKIPGVYTRVYPHLAWIENIVWP